MKPTIDRQLEKFAEWVSRRKWSLFPFAIIIPLLLTGINRAFTGKDFLADFGDYAEILVEMIVLGGIGVYICRMIAERSKIIQTLRESEGRYRALFESAGDSIYILDMDGLRPGQIVSANPAAAEMYGYTVEEMLSLNISDLETPQTASHVRARIERILRRETVKEETTHRRKDGTVFPLEINARLLEFGGHKYALAIDRDITERKAAEAALRTSEAQLSSAVILARLGHWEYDIAKDQFTFNDHFYKIFRTTAEQVGGYTMSSADYARRFVHPDDMPLVGNEIRKSLEATDSDYSQRLEHRIVYADGEIGYISVRIFLVKDDLGRTVGGYGVNQDITERKLAEQAVRESEQRYRSLFENMVEGYAYCKIIIEQDQPKDFVYLDVNEAFERLTGLKNVIGRRVTEAIPGIRESNPELFQTYGRVARTGEPEKLETYVKALGVWLSISVYSTERDHFVAVFDNVTERKHAENLLQQAENRYRRLFEDAPLMYVITRNEQGVPVVSDCNGSFMSSVGYRREEIVGKPLTDFYSPESRQELLERGGYARALEGEYFMGERQLLTRHGRLIPTLLYTATEVDPSGNVIGTRAMFVDITDQKSYEAQLEEANALKQKILSAAPVGIQAFKPDGRSILVNEAMGKVIGGTREQLLEQNFRELATWKESGLLNDADEVLATGVDKQREVSLVSTFGKKVQAEVRFTRFDSLGEPHLLLIVNDITERRQAEELLRLEREQLLSIFESINEVILVIDPLSHEILYANKFTEDLYGKGLVGGSCYEKLNGFPAPCEHCLNEKVVELRGQTYQWEYHNSVLNRDFLATDRLIKWPDGREVKFQLAIDITERKKAEDALRLSEERLELAVQAAELGLWEWDLILGKLAWYNGMHAEILGYSFDEMPSDLGKWKALFHPEDWPKVSETLNGHLQGRLPSIKVECRIRTKAGAWKWVMSQSKIVAYDKEGKPSRIAGTTLDINERKSAEQEQAGLRTQLLQAQKMEAIGTLAGGIAHDFNNLLTVILGFSELLLIGRNEQHPSYADLQKINQAARSGADLVKSILAFSRKSEISPRPLNLNREIEQVQRLLTRTIPKMIDISLVLSDNLATVNADPTQVEQILMNLAVNAKDAMPDGGKLTIETANAALDEEYSKTHLGAKPGDYVLLSVSDTGHGMDAETLQHIFEPFYTTKETGRGTGLGLAMVYGIVQQNSGHITCDSRVGAGTTFRLYLPAISSEIDSATLPQEAALSPGTETVLLVDDEEFIRDLGKRILERSGYIVLTAANGEEALDAFKKERNKISLVIMDLLMPIMGGKECLQKLLEIDPQVKVLLASGYTSGGTVRDASTLGAGGFVKKPYDIKELLRMVREILDFDRSPAGIK